MLRWQKPRAAMALPWDEPCRPPFEILEDLEVSRVLQREKVGGFGGKCGQELH